MLRSEPSEEKRDMSKTSATGASSAYQATIVDSTKLARTKVWGETDPAVSWAGAFALYGAHGTTASSTIVYEIEPGKRVLIHESSHEWTEGTTSWSVEAVGRRS
jgi:hypothetical protein